MPASSGPSRCRLRSSRVKEKEGLEFSSSDQAVVFSVLKSQKKWPKSSSVMFQKSEHVAVQGLFFIIKDMQDLKPQAESLRGG